MPLPAWTLRPSLPLACCLLLAGCPTRKQGESRVQDPPAPAAQGKETQLKRPEQPVYRAEAQAALERLQQRVRAAAAEPGNPWALTHGLLAFGAEFRARDGKLALAHIGRHLQTLTVDDQLRYGFGAEHEGVPVEPHPHIVLRTLMALELPRDATLTAADGTAVTLQRLLDDTRARLRVPQSELEWHNIAWALGALELARLSEPSEAATDPLLAELRRAAGERLQKDLAIVDAYQGPLALAFKPDKPMGAAKRNKSHIYGHSCGGFHFIQAVALGCVGGEQPQRDALKARLASLVKRHDRELVLYRTILKSHPGAKLHISVQQLKFYGHLLETLATVDRAKLKLKGTPLQGELRRVRREAVTELIDSLRRLQQLAAYDRLQELRQTQHQLYLDLIGDGCHAIVGLRAALPLLDADPASGSGAQ